MSDFFSAGADADLAVARIEEQIEVAQERARRASEVRERIDAVRGSATSSRRELTVTVDAGGRVEGVELTEAASRLSPRDLGRLIVETAAAAQRTAGGSIGGSRPWRGGRSGGRWSGADDEGRRIDATIGRACHGRPSPTIVALIPFRGGTVTSMDAAGFLHFS